jgi:hypothetical protein
MIGLLFELFEWMIKLTIIVLVVVAKTIAWTYRATERLIHKHRLRKDPSAERQVSQLIAGGTVAAGRGCWS